MKKTDTFFIISNFNTDPGRYLEYCTDYLIYDQSPDLSFREMLQQKYQKIRFVENTGHNLSDYFRFFADYWDSLPEMMMLAKGNMIGRHVSQEFFERVYRNRIYTFLYDDRACQLMPGVSYQLYDGAFIEANTSWYATTKPHRYFADYNALLRFIFKNPIETLWTLFSPGACYLLPYQHVMTYPAIFWRNMKNLVSYTYFPAEAYMVERMLPVIFSSSYETNPWMHDEGAFMEKLEEVRLRQHRPVESGKRLYSKIRSKLHRIALSKYIA